MKAYTVRSEEGKKEDPLCDPGCEYYKREGAGEEV